MLLKPLRFAALAGKLIFDAARRALDIADVPLDIRAKLQDYGIDFRHSSGLLLSRRHASRRLVSAVKLAQAFGISRFARFALRVGIVRLVVRLKRFEIIGEVGRSPVQPKLSAVGDQLPFSEGLGGGA